MACNSLDTFFCGEGYNEDLTGTFDSISWHQRRETNTYVYFTWAGNAANAIEVRKVSDPNGEPVERLTNDQFNGNPMVMNYINIDTSKLVIYDGDDNEIGFDDELFIRVCDNTNNASAGEYKFNTFGYLHVNASETDVSDAIWTHINSLSASYDVGNNEVHYRIHRTMNFYLTGKAKNLLTLSANKNVSADENFDSNADFLSRWYRDTNFDLIGWDDNGYHETHNINDHYHKGWDTIISSAENHQNDYMPFNKTGSGFFKGFYEPGYSGGKSEKDGASGFMDTDASRYRFVTKPFVLSGTGFVSVKMGGRTASLHVLQGELELAFIDLKTFNTSSGSGNNVTTGFNACTMVRHIINLSEFKNQVIQLAIADVDIGVNYGAICFDELITKYDSYPTFKVDTTVQQGIGGGIYNNNYYLDQYVSCIDKNAGAGRPEGIDYVNPERPSITADSTPVAEAYGFLSSFYSQVRVQSNTQKFSWCKDTSNFETLVSAYVGLGTDAKAIVDASEDFHYGDLHGVLVDNNTYYTSSIFKGFTVGQTMEAIRTGTYPVIPSSRITIFGAENVGTLLTVIISVATVSALTIGLFLLKKKRKEK